MGLNGFTTHSLPSPVKATPSWGLLRHRRIPFVSSPHSKPFHPAAKGQVRCNFMFGARQQTTRPPSARDQLVDALLTKGASMAQLSSLVDELCASSTRFDAKLLGGGPWVVAYTKGTPQLWMLTYEPSKALNGNNKASQEFDPNGQTVINKAEYFGGSLYVTATGTYQPLDNSRETPKAIQANIKEGCLHAWGLEIPLPIRGTGEFEVCYQDDTVRIFRSGGSYSVQVRADRLGVQ